MNNKQRMEFYALLDTITSEIVKLREKQIDMDTYALRPHFQVQLNGFREKCEALGVDRQVLEYMHYGLVAGIDEAALSAGGELAQFWMVSTLQFEYFGENVAGEKFYLNLEEQLKEPEKFSASLYLYYRMLGIGFEGKYFGLKEQREKIIEDCARALVRVHADYVPAVTEVVEAAPREVKKVHIPGWVYAIAVILLMVIGWFVNFYTSSSVTKELVKQVDQVSGQVSTEKADEE